MGTMTTEEILDELHKFVAEFMTEITTQFKGYEVHVASTLTASLAAYASIASKDPKKALQSIADSIAKADYNRIRAEHYGYAVLGVDEPKPAPKANLINIGEARFRKK